MMNMRKSISPNEDVLICTGRPCLAFEFYWECGASFLRNEGMRDINSHLLLNLYGTI